MCAVVEINGEVCTTQGDLMDALGTADLVPDFAHGYSEADIKQAMCLCPVDLSATATKHGYRLERGWTINCACDWRMVPNVELSGPQAALSPEGPARTQG